MLIGTVLSYKIINVKDIYIVLRQLLYYFFEVIKLVLKNSLGTLPNITRNAIVNAAELVCYDLIKEFILARKLMTDNVPCHFTSAFAAGFCATIVASPVDVVKTRFMNSSHGQYDGAVDCAVKMFKEGGFKAFYKG